MRSSKLKVHGFPFLIISGSTGYPIFKSNLTSSSEPSKMKKPCKWQPMLPFTIPVSSLNFLIFLLWIHCLPPFPPGTFVCSPQFNDTWQGRDLLKHIFLHHPQMFESPQMSESLQMLELQYVPNKYSLNSELLLSDLSHHHWICVIFYYSKEISSPTLAGSNNFLLPVFFLPSTQILWRLNFKLGWTSSCFGRICINALQN